MRGGSPAYDAVPELGLLYDHVPAYAARADVPFYVAEAVRAARDGGRVLELGCGTGRILLPVARAGVSVAGLDGSRAMLARCREKLAAEPAPVRERVTLAEGDVRDFALGERFALVTAPFRILQHILRIEDQLRVLDAIARHLAPGGHLVFDVFNPSFRALLGHDGAEHEEAPALRLPDGRRFRRAYRIPRVRWVDQVSETELIYYVSTDAGGTARHVQSFEMRWYLHAELVNLLARAGFAIADVYGDFARGTLTDASPEIVVRARLAAATGAE